MTVDDVLARANQRGIRAKPYTDKAMGELVVRLEHPRNGNYTTLVLYDGVTFDFAVDEAIKDLGQIVRK